jgi:drug/metabolite transporter (DMT)-like permease
MMGTSRMALAAVLAVVLLMAAGQLLFKATAAAWQLHGTLFAPAPALRLLASLAVYGIATLAWIWVLQGTSLSVAYPLVALTFVLVPLGAWWWFGESLSPRYMVGMLLIVAGIAVATWRSGGT